MGTAEPGALPRGFRLRETLAEGGLALGTWLSLGSAAAAEVLGHSGVDWLLVDQQHSPVGPDELYAMVRAINTTPAAPVVRIPRNEESAYDQALDSGAHGVMVPMVASREEAELAVARVRYPPRGRRSIGGYRAQYSFGLSRPEYLAADTVTVVVQVEEIAAVDRIEEIMAVPGIDACFIGPQDLAASMGLVPSLAQADPGYAEAIGRVCAAGRTHGVTVGILVADLAAARARAQQGMRLLAVGTDASSLGAAGSSLGKWKEQEWR